MGTKEEPVALWRFALPNAVTLLSLVSGLTSIPMGLDGEWETCCLLVFTAACLDTLDGIVARAVKGSSKFGAELDSLCDLVNFGVCPSILIYLWQLKRLGWIGWIISASFCACMACRLARFNTGADHSSSSQSQSAYAKQVEQRENEKKNKNRPKSPNSARATSPKPIRSRPSVGSSYRHYFMGVPAPAGAILALAPMLWYEKLKFKLSWILPVPWPDSWVLFFAIYIAVVSFLLVSTLPTFSSKMFGKDWIPVTTGGKLIIGVPAFIAFVVYIYYLGIDGWWAGLGLLATYLGSFPVSYVRFHRMKSMEEAQQKKQ